MLMAGKLWVHRLSLLILNFRSMLSLSLLAQEVFFFLIEGGHLAHGFWGLGFRKAASQITDKDCGRDWVALACALVRLL